MADDKLVLITGGSGFIALYCILQCLAEGYRVRTTVRSLTREADVRKLLETGKVTNIDKLSFVVADLSKDEGWPEAVAGCEFVLHVASPFPAASPKNEDELIIPAVEGTIRVLRAARDAGVKRVVQTSSFAAIGYGHPKRDEPFTEATWTNVDEVDAYAKSKTLAEKAAWVFIEKEGGSLELAVVNPVLVLGPVLGNDYSTSVIIVERMLKGSMPACPRMSYGVVDVRDVADLHIRCMTSPQAKGQRFLAVSPPSMKFIDMATTLREKLGDKARKAPTKLVPNFALKALSWFDPSVALIYPDLEKYSEMSNEKAVSLLGWKPRANTEALVATAESLIELGIVKV